VHFDIPEAETEIVASLHRVFRQAPRSLKMTVDVEAIVAASLLAPSSPFGLACPPSSAFLSNLLKVFLVLVLLTLLRTIMARLRIDQMMAFCWRSSRPRLRPDLASLVLKGVFVMSFPGKMAGR